MQLEVGMRVRLTQRNVIELVKFNEEEGEWECLYVHPSMEVGGVTFTDAFLSRVASPL